MDLKMILIVSVFVLFSVLISACITENNPPAIVCESNVVDEEWINEVINIKWVDYSPPTADPEKGIEATRDAVVQDLTILKKAGFTGLVTYSSDGILGRDLPALAEQLSFEGMIMGIWDPASQEELANAVNAAKYPVVIGYCVGNEGLNHRYDVISLNRTMNEIRTLTGKPVTTTEEIEDYNATILMLGDWIFPNAHPYFHNLSDPVFASKWTIGAYNDMQRRSNRFVLLKEVGLPTAGDPEGKLSETVQDRYYQLLEKSAVHFIYFEAFDQSWKDNLPVEPHWGIFYVNRTPKLIGLRLLGKVSPSAPLSSGNGNDILPVKSVKDGMGSSRFYIYQDADSAENHFVPSGYMGDIGDIYMYDADTDNPHNGKTSIQVTYKSTGEAPHSCPYNPPCKWAGVYWQDPPNNWGNDAVWKEGGYDLTSYSRLVFWARADTQSDVLFKVGGIIGPYGDSIVYPQGIEAHLSPEWQHYEIDLENEDRSHVIGGFMWVSNWDANPEGIKFYLDDIYYE